MIQRYSLATTRQLELSCIASTSTFLLPFFSNPSISQRPIRSSVSKASTSRKTMSTSSQKQSGSYGDVLGWMQNQVQEVLGKGVQAVGKSRERSKEGTSILLSKYSSIGRARVMVGSNYSGSRRSYTTATLNDLSLEENEKVVKEKVIRKDKIKKVASPSIVKVRIAAEEEIIRNRNAVEQKESNNAPLPHPPDDSASPTDPLTLESRIPSPRNQYLPLFPKKLTRKELMSLICSIPPTAFTSYLLRVRTIIIDQKLLDDTGPVVLFIRACIHRQLKSVALRFMKQAANARKANNLSNETFFDSPLKLLLQNEDWEALEVFSSAALLHSTTLFILRSRMRALYETKQYSKVIATFELFRNITEVPDGECLDDLLGAHLMSGNLTQAQATLAEKSQLGYPTTVRTCIALLDGMWPFGGNKIMEEKVLNDVLRDTISKEKALRQDVRILNRIMSIRAARGDVEDALAVLQYFDLSKFNKVLIPLTKARKSSAVIRSRSDSTSTQKAPDFPSLHNQHFIVSSRGNKPRPDISTIVTLISIYLRLEQPHNAIDLFAASQKLNLGLNEHLITSLVKISLASERDSIKSAEALVFALPNGNAPIPGSTVVVEAPFEPTAMVYEVLLAGVLKTSGLKGASAFLNRMIINRKRSIVITEGMVDVIVRHLSLDSIARTRTYETAKFIYKIQSMTKGATRPNIKNLNAMLGAAWRKDRFEKVGGRRKKVKQLELPSASPSATSIIPTSSTISPDDPNPNNTVTTSFTSPSASIAIIPPVTRSVNFIPSPTFRIRQSLADRGIQNDRSTTQQVLRNDKAFATVDLMWDYLETQLIERGVQPTYQHIAIIMRSYIRLGDLEGARSVLIKCKSLGVNLHVSLYSVLISGASKFGHPDIAKDLYREMKREGLLPDRPLYARLALECARFGDLRGVDSIIADASRKLVIPISPIDPIFTLIRYRALVTNGRIYNAQKFMAAKLKEGMKPDLATFRTISRTVRWLTHKLMGKSRKKLLRSQNATLEAAERNLSLVSRLITKKRKMGEGQLKKLKEVLEESKAGEIE